MATAQMILLDVPAGVGVGAPSDVSGWPSRKFVLVFAASAEICQIEASADGATWAPALQFRRVPGLRLAGRDLPVRWLRLRRLQLGAGAPVVQVCGWVDPAAVPILVAALPSPVGVGPGPAVDVSALPPGRLVVADGGAAEVYRVEISGDGVTGWFPLFSSASPGDRVQGSDLAAAWARVYRIKVDPSSPLTVWMTGDPAAAGGGGGGPPAAHRATHFSSGTDAMEAACYPVFVGGPHATIAAAIAAAVAAGHLTNLNPAVVRVYPRAGGWLEDVALSPGVHVEGVSSAPYAVWIRSLAYTPPAGLDPVSGLVEVRGIRTFAGAGVEAAAIIGANFGRLLLRDCVISQSGGGAANVRVNCTGLSAGASAELACVDCTGQVQPGGLAYQVTAGLLTLSRCDVSGVGAARALHVQGVSQVVGLTVNLVGAGADVLRLELGANVMLLGCQIHQLAPGADGAVLVAGSILTLLSSLVNVPLGAGYAVRGAGLFAYGGNAYALNPNVQVPGLTLAPLAVLPVPVP